MASITVPIPTVEQQIKLIGLKPDWYIGLSSVLLLFTTIAIGLRGYVRLGMLKSFGSDDAALLVAYIVFVALACVFIAVGAQQRQEGVLTPFVQQVYYVLAAEMLYLLQAITLKIALAAFFLRITHIRWQQWVLKLSVLFYSLYQVSFAFVCLFQCGPIRNFVAYNPAQCLPWHGVMAPLTYISAALNALVDWIMVAMMLLVITGLQMTRRDKYSVTFLIFLALLGSIVSIVRIPLMSGLEVIPDIKFFGNILPASFCSEIESALGLTALSLAALRPLFRHVRDKSSLKTPPPGSDNSAQKRNSTYTHSTSQPNSQSHFSRSNSHSHTHSKSQSSWYSPTTTLTNPLSNDASSPAKACDPDLFPDDISDHITFHDPPYPGHPLPTPYLQGPTAQHPALAPRPSRAAKIPNDNDDDDLEVTSKPDLVDFPTSIYSSGRRHQRVPVDEEWFSMGQIRLEVTTTVSSSRAPPGFAAGVSTNAFS